MLRLLGDRPTVDGKRSSWPKLRRSPCHQPNSTTLSGRRIAMVGRSRGSKLEIKMFRHLDAWIRGEGTFYRDLPMHEVLQWRFRRWLERLAWPPYDCENCVGVFEGVSSCYCAYYGAIAPNIGPTRWHLFVRSIHKRLYPNSGLHK